MIPTSIKNLGYIIAAILGIQYDAVVAFSLLMVFDVATGIFASASIDGWRSITSKKLAFGLLSKLLLLLVPLSIALAGTVIGENLSALVKSSIAILTLSEAYSIIGNVYAVKTGKRVPEFDAISVILKKIREVLHTMTK